MTTDPILLALLTHPIHAIPFGVLTCVASRKVVDFIAPPRLGMLSRK